MKTPTPRSRRTVLTLAGAAALGSLAGCLGRGFSLGGEASETLDRGFSAASIESVVVRNVVGDVTVVGTDAESIRVRVEKHSRNGKRGLDAITVDIDDADGSLSVVTRFDGRDWFDTDTPMADVTVTVPKGNAGPIVRSIHADIGSIDLQSTRGDTVVKTELGDVTASNVDGYLTLESELGTIEAGNVAGLDRVFTELGDVKVDLLGARGDVDVGTDLGSVTVGVADDLALDVLAESQGSVSSDLTLSALESSGRRVSGLLNGGGERLTVSSELGDVALRALSRADRE